MESRPCRNAVNFFIGSALGLVVIGANSSSPHVTKVWSPMTKIKPGTEPTSSKLANHRTVTVPQNKLRANTESL